jgi:glycosyltransferase involved in cell wall biosynthesis
MKRTCFFLTSLDSGGTERYLLRFLEYSQNNINATVICKSGNLGSLEDNYKNTNAKIIPLKTGYFNLFSWIKLYKLFKKNKFDSVVDLTGNFGGMIMIISFFAGVKKRIVFYRYSSNQFKENQFKLIYNGLVKFLVFKYATLILSNSKTAFKFFFPRDYENDKRFKVIFNGVNSKNFNINESKEEIRNTLGIKKNTFLIGHIGRYDISKNHKTIFKVAKELIEKDTTIEFLFCGMDTNSSEFKKQISNHSMIKNVHLLGERSDIPRILKSLDIFYFPSITEGQPNALIEAMLSNLPIVTSNIASIKEIMPKQMHQHLISPLDFESTLKEIKLLKRDSKLQDSYHLEIWASKKFNSKINFKKFKIEL